MREEEEEEEGERTGRVDRSNLRTITRGSGKMEARKSYFYDCYYGNINIMFLTLV